MNLSPILISVYNRKEHFEKCIEALKSNKLANDTVLYIVSDGAYRSEDEKTIQEIRSYIKTIKGFKNIVEIFREKNYGSYKSVKEAINQVLEIHKKIIFIEDDIICSEYFLTYMNQSLISFEDKKDIFAICAFSPPDFEIPKSYKDDIYLWNYFCPWGMALWKDRWDNLDTDLLNFETFLRDKKKVYKFFKGSGHSLGILLEDRSGKITAMDVRIEYNMFVNNWKAIFPVKSMTKNIGTDGSGEHSGISKKYLEQKLEKFNPEINKFILEDKMINKARSDYHRIKFREKLVLFLKVFGLYNIVKKIKNMGK